MNPSRKLLIIGAGPGGYTAAFHAADLGLDVTLVDPKANPGGVCLHEGCIPSKAFLHAARLLHDARTASHIGIQFGAPVIVPDTLRSWKDGIIIRLTNGLSQLARQRKITYIQGTARLLDSARIEINKTDGSLLSLPFDQAIIATGARPIELPFLPKSSRVWDSAAALTLPCIPPSLLVIGGGYIGLELGTIYAELGTKVSVVEALPKILKGSDQDLADITIRQLKKIFTRIMTGTRLLKAEETADGIQVTLQDSKGQESTETYSHVLTAVGRRPNTHNLGLENTKIKLTEQGFIDINTRFQTAEPNIFAIGDIIGPPQLAHKASYEAKTIARILAGKDVTARAQTIPAVIFTDPEMAWAGLTEQAARDQNLPIKVFKFPWAASGRALTLDRTDGLTKIIADATTQRILGIGIVGIGAGELIAQGLLAIDSDVTADEFASIVHPHPTLSETLMETAEGLFDACTHLIRPK